MAAAQRYPGSSTSVAVGYGANARGAGVAYARISSGATDHLLRVTFRAQRVPELEGREVGYAALGAVAHTLRNRGIARATFALGDAQLVADIVEHRDVPGPIVVPYVRLRCALNAFDRFDLEV